MKKLFTFSVLSMLAVMGVAQAELAGEGFVTAGRINQELYGFTKNESVVRSTGQALNGIADISDDVAAEPDSYIPTVGMVEANFVPNENVAPMEVAENLQQAAVDVQSGKTFTESEVEGMNSAVPSVGVVAGSFVPNVATTYKDDYFGDVSNEMHPGLYTIMVEVDESGNKTFIWQAVQQTRQSSSVGGVMPN